MNISKHAHMRFCQKLNKQVVINDRTFDAWRSMNEELAEELHGELLKLYEESEYITDANYENSGKKRYHIHRQEMMAFVIDKEKGTIVTVYPIEYDLDEQGNREMLNLLFTNYMRLNEQKMQKEDELSEKISVINGEIEILNAEIEKAEAELRMLRLKKDEKSNEKAFLNLEIEEKDKAMKAIQERIVRSKVKI